MVQKHRVEGYENFLEYMKKFTKEDLVHVYFSGSKMPDGNSWCDDCVRAWPVVEEALSTAPENSHFVYVEVGDRPYWKDPKCPFRTSSQTKLMVLPSMLRWNGCQRLEGEQCEKADLLEMLLTDED